MVPHHKEGTAMVAFDDLGGFGGSADVHARPGVAATDRSSVSGDPIPERERSTLWFFYGLNMNGR